MAEQIKYRVLDTLHQSYYHFDNIVDYTNRKNLNSGDFKYYTYNVDIYKTQQVEVFKLLQNTQVPVFYVYVNGKFTTVTQEELQNFKIRTVLEVAIGTTNVDYPNFVKRLDSEEIEKVIHSTLE